jgi:hypothetical protein
MRLELLERKFEEKEGEMVIASGSAMAQLA